MLEISNNSKSPNESGHEKTCLMSVAKNKGAGQPAHPCSLISAFVVHCLDSILSLDSIAEISKLQLASEAAQAGNLKIISDSRIRYIVSKGPKYRFPSRIDFKKCREEIASALNDFGNRWCKREYVEPDALKEWKVSIFKIVDQHIKFYSQNTNLLPPKPKSTFRHLKQGIQDFHRKYVLVPADKAANNVVVV